MLESTYGDRNHNNHLDKGARLLEIVQETIERGGNVVIPAFAIGRTKDESKAINKLKEPYIVISANGMCTGGRVLYHLIHNLERPESTVLLVGYQAEGTPGRELQNGAKTVSIMGKRLNVKARIESLGGFSAHAGRSEILD